MWSAVRLMLERGQDEKIHTLGIMKKGKRECIDMDNYRELGKH